MRTHLCLTSMFLALLAIPCVTPALADDPPQKTVKLVPPKDLAGWQTKGDRSKSHWTVGTATIDPANPTKLRVTPEGDELVNVGEHGVDIYSDAKFGDAVIELEVMVPKGANSGIYIMGEYELQILDSYDRTELGMGDMGAIYGAAVPSKNASKAPGEWQKYVIEYHAPRFDGTGKKIANAMIVRITLNDQLIHSNLELKGPTPGGITGQEASTGPLLFQGDHGEVAYRNICITPIGSDAKRP